MSEELMLLTNGTEKESPKPNHYVDDPSFIREEETPEAREKQFKEMQRSMRPGYVRLRSMEEMHPDPNPPEKDEQSFPGEGPDEMFRFEKVMK